MNVSAANAQALNVPPELSSSAATAKAASSEGKKVAQQFEAILTRQFLSKTVSSMMDSDKNPAGDVYGYFLTDVLAQKMSEGSGLGLGKVLERQLSGGSASGAASSAASRAAATAATSTAADLARQAAAQQ